MNALIRCGAVAACSLALASPAAAQWTRVEDVAITSIYSVWVQDSMILASADSVVYISIDGGATWKGSVDVADGVTSVQAARARSGRIYAATYGQGVFTSDDLGDSWQAFNQGLTGGVLDTQRFVIDLVVRGDSLYAATAGDGPWVRNLVAGQWTHFSNVFEPNAASNMNGIASGGNRLIGCAGFNGTVFFRDTGDADWTLSWLNNTGLAPGLGAISAIWTGSRWVVGSNIGVFHSAQGQSPWTFVDPGLGTLFNVAFALRGSDIFAAFGTGISTTIAYSLDQGSSWQFLETQPSTFVFGLAIKDTTLYAGRGDGLWRRSVATVRTKASTLGGLKALYRGQRK